MEPWKSSWNCPLVHSCLLKKAPSPWNFQGFQGHLSAPDLGLACSNLPRDWRMRARTFTEMSVSGWLAPSCASHPESALPCSSSAWRLELAPCGTTNEQRKCEAILCSQCGMPITMYYPYIIIYQYQLHSFRGLPTSARKLVGTVWGPWRCHILFSMPLYISNIMPHLQEFTRKI